MPLVPSTITGSTMSKAASKGLTGSKLRDIVSAVASATSSYLMGTSVVQSMNIVIGPGAGTQTGKVIGLIPSAMSSIMVLKAVASGLTGKDSKNLFDSISFGVVQAMNSVIVQGAVIGGAPGTGTGKIIGLVPSALQGLIMVQLRGKLMFGSKTLLLVAAIANGICNHIMSTGTVQLIDVGAFAPPPVGPIPIPAAPGTGRFT